MLPNGSINLGEMTSFNYYALRAVATWMHNVIRAWLEENSYRSNPWRHRFKCHCVFRQSLWDDQSQLDVRRGYNLTLGDSSS